ncbi:hypothetical protein T4B_7141 [Trichinella pseudospiralis]|uniref:Secreted protein n=1 Tax=Trichinella pseudospiralis TaxID=6337 RepID=A0A0V1DXX2_TRIPS|nr:hypothetical protein T4A_12841 [Trichinella pseudospiralis]KRZ13384.1 hypothetical protein T4B_7141 [Trichinella pseudospiralis]KRZ42951.1 hypothetical protein T4C_10514 [Trichinella pseudospiralis]
MKNWRFFFYVLAVLRANSAMEDSRVAMSAHQSLLILFLQVVTLHSHFHFTYNARISSLSLNPLIDKMQLIIMLIEVRGNIRI